MALDLSFTYKTIMVFIRICSILAVFFQSSRPKVGWFHPGFDPSSSQANATKYMTPEHTRPWCFDNFVRCLFSGKRPRLKTNKGSTKYPPKYCRGQWAIKSIYFSLQMMFYQTQKLQFSFFFEALI